MAIADGEGAPEWLHLLPAGEIQTQDDRGPYRVKDYQALMAASLQPGEKLVLDENHSTDLAAPKGGEAPARGWIVELQQRSDGIWGRVEWTAKGRALAEAREYRGISPVIAHLKDKTVVAIKRASLTNQPNFKGLVSLHMENSDMDLLKEIAKLLGMAEDTSAEDVFAAIKKKMDDGDADTVKEAVQSVTGPLAKELGLAADADGAALLAGIGTLKQGASSGDKEITALQSELTKTTTALQAMQEERKKDKATAFVDGAIKDGRVGVKPQRDTFISMHMENAERTEGLINAMPKMAGNIAPRDLPETEEADPVELAAQAADYQKKQQDAGREISFSAAVRAVQGAQK